MSITSQQNGLKFITYPPTPLRIYDSITRSTDWSGLDFGQAGTPPAILSEWGTHLKNRGVCVCATRVDITVTIYGYVYADYAGDGLWVRDHIIITSLPPP